MRARDHYPDFPFHPFQSTFLALSNFSETADFCGFQCAARSSNLEGTPMNRQLPVEAGMLPFHLPPRFERFYRSELRRVVGARMRGAVIHEAYTRWAAEKREASMSTVGVRRCIEAIGHARRVSNGVQYLDLAFAADYPEAPDTLTLPIMVQDPAKRLAPALAPDAELIGKVDAVIASLLDLRRGLTAIGEQRDPYAAAQRVLGLLSEH